jgi:serine/threonine-protein kinase
MEPGSQQTNRLGRYRLLSTLGQGGMGTIWLAVAGGLGEFRKLLVIKELRWDLTRNERFVEMFLDEAKLAARLNHPNVVQTLEAGEEDSRYFLSMEFLDGQPLSEVMKRGAQDPALSLGVRLRILCGALAGLHYAHELRDYDGTELQIVHRDISPQNVFVTYDGQVKVVDFGIAKAADAGTFTQPGIFKGKFAYASPEQIKGLPVDRRADVFAMGVLLWEVVTLRRFAKGKPTQLSIEARLTGLEPRLAEVEREVDPLLSEICDRAMEVEPSKRFATADDFRLALEQYLTVTGEGVETSTIAAFMRQAFAAERGAMHRMIDGHLKDADLSESLVRRLRPTPREITQDEPTTVADLSELIQSSRSELPKPPASDGDSSTVNGWNRSLRSGSGRKVWIAGAVIGIAALAAYALRDRLPLAASPHAPETKTVQQAATVPPPPVVAEPKPSEPAPAEVAAPPPVVATPQQPYVQENPPRDDAERKVRRQGQRSQGSEDDEGGPMPGMLFGDLDADPESIPFQGPRMKDLEGEDRQAGGKEAPAIGEDLRQLRKDNRRKLDLEDPFQ